MPAIQKSLSERPYFLRNRNLGPLQEALLLACQPAQKGFVSIPLFSTQIKLHPVTVYTWIKRGRIPQRYVGRVLALANGRVTFEDLAPFVDH